MYSLLDAAALVATAPLDLSNHEQAPDFTALSFYKIFGFPDLGALIVRKASASVLSRRRYFGGGTVDMVINAKNALTGTDNWFARKATSLHEMLEDGTPPFHSIIALDVALRTHKKLFASMESVSMHAGKLAKSLHQQLLGLSHANGMRVCVIYNCPSSTYNDTKTQGPTIAFGIQNSRGGWIGKSDSEALAILNNIQIRTGGLCNPGGIATYLDMSPYEMYENFREGLRCGNELDELNGKPTGVIRVSLGAMSSTEDVLKLMDFMQLFVDRECRAPYGIGFAEQEEKVQNNPTCDLAKSSTSECVVRILTVSAQLKCPVAACVKQFESRQELTKHLPYHKASGKQKKGRLGSQGFAQRCFLSSRPKASPLHG